MAYDFTFADKPTQTPGYDYDYEALKQGWEFIEWNFPEDAPEDINESQRELTFRLLGAQEFIPLVYGRAYLSGRLFTAAELNGNLVIGWVFCLGEVSELEALYLDEVDVDESDSGLIARGGSYNFYVGDQVQTADPLLAQAIPGYEDDLKGVCYVVTEITPDYTGIPKVTAVIKTRKVIDPEVSMTDPVFSTTPALWLADFITSTNPDYGMGEEIDWDSVIAAKQANEEQMSDGTPRRGGGFCSVTKATKTSTMLKLLSTMSGCWITRDAFRFKLVPNRKEDPATIPHAVFTDENILAVRSIRKLGQMNNPTAVQVQWTDTSKLPWRQKRVWSVHPDVELGKTSFRPSTWNLKGITSLSQAKREATEKLNSYTLDLEVVIDVADEGARLLAGDIVSVTHQVGLTDKLMRLVQDPLIKGPGLYSLKLKEYDPGIYSDEILIEPTYPDTELPDIYSPPQVQNVRLTEQVDAKADGTLYSRVAVVWDKVDWPYTQGYEILVMNTAYQVQEIGTVGRETFAWMSAPLSDLHTVVVGVRAYSTFEQGEMGTAMLELQGKKIIPPPPPSGTAFEVGGEVHVRWDRPNDPDVRCFEIRYYRPSQVFENGEFLDMRDTQTLTTKEIAPGDWIIGVKTVDSIWQRSIEALEIPITVTEDPDSVQLVPQCLYPDKGTPTQICNDTIMDDMWILESGTMMGGC